MKKNSNYFYKTMISQITADGKDAGNSILTEDFSSLKEALKKGAEYSLSSLCSITIKEYDATKNQIISFDSQDTGKEIYHIDGVITNKTDLIKKVMEEYHSNDQELSEVYFDDILIKMPKREVLQAWVEIQKECNGDTIIRLKKDGTEYPTLIPDSWGKEKVYGCAIDILDAINEEKKTGGPIFARIYNDNEPYLDLEFGEFDESCLSRERE